MIFSCSNIKVIPISEDIKKIKLYSSTGEIIKTIYKKYDESTNDWYVAKCERTGPVNKCNYTGVSINPINLRKEKDDLGQSNNNEQNQSNEKQQDETNDKEQNQSNEQQQDGSNNNEQNQSETPPFGFGGCIGCENFND